MSTTRAVTKGVATLINIPREVLRYPICLSFSKDTGPILSRGFVLTVDS
jgi:hypothetical protein